MPSTHILALVGGSVLSGSMLEVLHLHSWRQPAAAKLCGFGVVNKKAKIAGLQLRGHQDIKRGNDAGLI